jgi:hypothetical protein
MKNKTVDAKLSDFLGIEAEIKETSQELIVKANSDIQEYQESNEDSREEDIKNDYEFHRGNLHDLVEKGQDTLNNLIELAKQSEHPRAYEVVGQLMKTTSDLTKDLIELQVTMNKIQNTKEGGPSKVVNNNAVFVGNTNDLLEIVKGKNRVIGNE